MSSPYTSTTSWQRWTNTLASRKWKARYHPLNHAPRFVLRRRSPLVIVVAALGTAFVLMQGWSYTTRRHQYQNADKWIAQVFPGAASELESDKPSWSQWLSASGQNMPLEQLVRNGAEDHEYACSSVPLPRNILRGFYFENIETTDGPERRQQEAINLFPKEPTLILPHSRGPIANTAHLKPGQPYCMRIVIPSPQSPQIVNDEWRWRYVPYSGGYWDSLMVDLVSRTSQLTLPVRLEQWAGHSTIFANVKQQEPNKVPPHEILSRDQFHVYEAELRIVDEGIYDLVTRLEYTDGRWNFEAATIVPYAPVFVYPPKGFTITVDPVSESAQQKHSSKTPSIAQQNYKNHFSLPLCTRPDHPGRWMNIADFPESEQTLAAATDWQGNFWAPFECRHRKYKYPEFTRCLARKYPIIHWFGDSNSRRALKKLVTQGAWCTNVTEINEDEAKRRNCHCEDYREESWNSDVFNPFLRANKVSLANTREQDEKLDKDGTPWNSAAGLNGEATTRDDAEIWFYKWDGLTNLNDPRWEECFHEYPSSAELARYLPNLKVDEEWVRRYDANTGDFNELDPLGKSPASITDQLNEVIDEKSGEENDTSDKKNEQSEGELETTAEVQADVKEKRSLPAADNDDDDDDDDAEFAAIKSRMSHLANLFFEKYIEDSPHAVVNASSSMLPPWHPEPLFPSHFYSTARSGPNKRWYLTLAPPQLVIISLGNWDTAWMPMTDYVYAIAKLTAYILQRYVPYKVSIIYRPPQYYCCRTDDSEWQRRLSTKRVEAYDAVAREMLTTKVGAKVWDVYALGEARSWENKQLNVDCASNHVGSDIVEIENQILMNALCNSEWFDDDQYKTP